MVQYKMVLTSLEEQIDGVDSAYVQWQEKLKSLKSEKEGLLKTERDC